MERMSKKKELIFWIKNGQIFSPFYFGTIFVAKIVCFFSNQNKPETTNDEDDDDDDEEETVFLYLAMVNGQNEEKEN